MNPTCEYYKAIRYTKDFLLLAILAKPEKILQEDSYFQYNLYLQTNNPRGDST